MATSFTANSISLTWTAATTAPDAYVVSYGVFGSLELPQTLATTATVATLRGLVPGTRYQIAVSARVGRSSSAFSNTILVTTTAIVVGSPSDLTLLSATASSLTLGWSAVARASNYQLRYRLSTSTTPRAYSFQNVGNALTDTISGLDAFSDYQVSVRALVGSAYSDWAGDVSAMTKRSLPIPANVRASNIRSTSFRVAWDSIAGVRKFEVTARDPLGVQREIQREITGSVTLIVAGVEPATSYILTIRAFSTEAGEFGPDSTPIIVITAG